MYKFLIILAFASLFFVCGGGKDQSQEALSISCAIEPACCGLCSGASIAKSTHPEFIGIWKNEDFTDACTQTTITYNFNDTVVSLWTFDQIKDACATHSNYNLQLEWKIESGQYCEKVWMSDVSPWNCYSYSINATDLTIDSKVYTKQ